MQQNPSLEISDLNYTTRDHTLGYLAAKFATLALGSVLTFGAFGFSFVSGNFKSDSTITGIKYGLKAGGAVAALVAGLWKYFDYKENQEHLKIHNQVTHNKLTQVFCKNGSDGGARITYDEQCQIREMIESKNSIFLKFSPKSNERYNLEEYYNKMIDQFSSPESEDGERITYFEQCQLNEIALSRADLL